MSTIKLRFIMILLLPALLCGCSSENEISGRAFARVMGIDGERVCLLLFDGNVAHGSGATVPAAVDSASVAHGADIAAGHTELILFGKGDFEKLSRDIIKSGEIMPSCMVAYCDKPSDVIETDSLPERIKTGERKLKIVSQDIKGMADGLLSRSECAYALYFGAEAEGMCVINRSGALFVLTEKEAMGLALLRGGDKDAELDCGARITKSKCRISAELSDDGLRVKLAVCVNASDSSCAEEIKSACEAAVRATALEGCDVLGIEQALGGYEGGDWKGLLKTGAYAIEIEVKN